MEFFEKLGKNATDTFNSAGEKANRFAGKTKLKFKINDNKSKIKDLYQDIGKKVYQKYVLDGNLDIKEEIQEELTKIAGLSDEIEIYENQMLALDDKKQCVNCKNKIEKSVKFCPECGAEQPQEPVQEAEIIQEEEEKSEEAVQNAEAIEKQPESVQESDVIEGQETIQDVENTGSEQQNVENKSVTADDNQTSEQQTNSDNAEQVSENTEEVVATVVNEENNNNE